MIVEPIIIKQKLQNNKITDQEPELPGPCKIRPYIKYIQPPG